jgi:hypothetical protein
MCILNFHDWNEIKISHAYIGVHLYQHSQEIIDKENGAHQRTL